MFAAGVLSSIVVCCYGTSTRDTSSIYAFHVLVAALTLCMGLLFTIVIVTFVAMDAQQYISAGWKNWNLNLTAAEKYAACTDKLPTTDPEATNVGPGSGGHQENPIPLGCDFYYNMRIQSLVIFLIVSVTATCLSCMLCVLGFQLYEVIAGPQKDPMMERTMGTAAGRLQSLLSEQLADDIENRDGSDTSQDGSDKQIAPVFDNATYLPPGEYKNLQ